MGMIDERNVNTRCKECIHGESLDAPVKWDYLGNEIEYSPTGLIECKWVAEELPTAFKFEGIHMLDGDAIHDCPCFTKDQGGMR